MVEMDRIILKPGYIYDSDVPVLLISILLQLLLSISKKQVHTLPLTHILEE